MELITYRKTLDVHKNGVQFLLQGFQTADKMSRVIEISLMASGDAIDFPLERIAAVMYVTSPGATEPSKNECTIVDNKIVYNVLPITAEGITKMQVKLIETSIDGAKSVLASPEFAVEVSKSEMGDEDEEPQTTHTALENFIAKAETAYAKRLERIELANDCMFYAYYADGTTYETDLLQKLFTNGNVLLSESYAHGGTGTRIDEDTDNAMYYSNVSKSEALNAKNIMKDSKEVLEEVKLHGMYTVFSIDFDTGKVEYVSPSFKFKVNPETGNLDAEGQTYTFEDEIYRVVEDWLANNGVVLKDLEEIATSHTMQIRTLQGNIKELQNSVKNRYTKEEILTDKTRELLKLASNDVPDTALTSLYSKLSVIPSYLSFVNGLNVNAALGMNNEDYFTNVGMSLAMYGWFNGDDKTTHPFTNLCNMATLNDMNFDVYSEIIESDCISTLLLDSTYACDKVFCMVNIAASIYENTREENQTEVITTVDIIVSEDDLKAPFRLDYNLMKYGDYSNAVLYINDVFVAEAEHNNEAIIETHSYRNWHTYNITSPGTYVIKAIGSLGHTTWDYAEVKAMLYKAKQQY